MRMRRRPKAFALLIDFDGVLRHYDRDGGPLLEAGLSWQLYIPAVTGVWTRSQWLEAIAAQTGATREEVSEWDSYRGRIDAAVLDLVRQVRAADRPVALCTNATDDLRLDLQRFGIEGE